MHNLALERSESFADAVEELGRLAEKRAVDADRIAAYRNLAGRRSGRELRLDLVQFGDATVDVGFCEILDVVLRVCVQAVGERLQVGLQRVQEFAASEFVERIRARERADRAAVRERGGVIDSFVASLVDDLGHLQDEGLDFADAPVALEHHLLERRLRLGVLCLAEGVGERGR